ncbi:MAG TPA: DUF6049 family protein [Actinomycetes bacterium]|nr:DUF6049 family protein [Actinomycetes bacterium]
MTAARTPTRALAALALAVTLVAALTPASAAQEAAPSLEVVLTGISTVVGPRAPLDYQVTVRNRGQEPVRDLLVQARLGPQVDTRSELATVLAIPAGDVGGQPLDAFRPSGAELSPGAARPLERRRVDLPPGLGDQRAGVVLPLSIEVQASGPDGPVTAALVTYVVDLAAGARQPLRATLLVPVREPTHRNPAGDFIDDKLAGLLAPGGSLGAVVTELARPAAPAATMVVDAMLVEDATAMVGGWRLRQGGRRTSVPPGDPRSVQADKFLQALKAAASRHRPAAFAYGNADLPALVRAGGAARAEGPVRTGRNLLANGLGTAPDESLAWPVDGAIDGALLEALDQTGGDVVVLEPRHLPAPSGEGTQNATVDLGGGPSPQRALVGDAVLSGALTDPRAASAPVEWAQRLLAETAVTWLERPNSSEPRGILLAPPQDWRPTRAFFRSLVRGLGAAPWLRLQPASTLAGEVAQGPAEGERRLATVTAADVAAGLPRSYLNRVEQTRAQLDSFRRAVGNDFQPADGGSLERDLLLVAESSDWRPAGARERGRGFVRAIGQGIKSVYRHVAVITTPVTLTARSGKIPITVANGSAERITVVLRLTSPKVDLPGASEPFVLEPRRRTTQLLQVGTRATGTFPIRVDVLTPDGEVRIASGDIRLTSTAFNRVALALTGGAAGLLLLWWRFGRRRRNGTDNGTEA